MEKPWVGWYRLGGRVFTQYGHQLSKSAEMKGRWTLDGLPGHPRCSQTVDCVGSKTSQLVHHRVRREPAGLYCRPRWKIIQEFLSKHPQTKNQPLEGETLTAAETARTLPMALSTFGTDVLGLSAPSGADVIAVITVATIENAADAVSRVNIVLEC